MPLSVTTESAPGDMFEGPFIQGPYDPVQLEITLDRFAQVIESIAAVDTTANTVTIPEGTVAAQSLFPWLQVDDEFDIQGSSGNDGTYTIAGVVHDSGNSQIVLTVDGSIGDSTADGEVVLSLPRPDLVHEDGVLPPGLPVRKSGDHIYPIDGNNQTAFGVIGHPADVAATYEAADMSGTKYVAVHTGGVLNQGLAEDNLARSLTSDEQTAIDNAQDLRLV